MNDKTKNSILEEIIQSLDIPESAYEKALGRYKDLGNWFDRPESECSKFSPRITSQGSFRLGTVNRPLNEDDEYDLDLGCRLRIGITKQSHTQKDLKQLVGKDLAAYRQARGIEAGLEDKNRCWRLRYKDELNFHLDAVPSIPENSEGRQLLKEAMAREGVDLLLAEGIASFAGAITDNRHAHFEGITPDWRISNSEGFARWFESRMKLAKLLMERVAKGELKAQVDDLPAYKWKSPLQRCIQILKRHRDVMFKEEPDCKPISVIITTLAARAYQGEVEIADTLERVLSDMEGYVRATKPRVPNPVNPAEDFADKWYDPKYQHLQLEQNFRSWVKQARSDFQLILSATNAQVIVEQAHAKFEVNMDVQTVREKLGLSMVSVQPTKIHQITEPAKPWMRL